MFIGLISEKFVFNNIARMLEKGLQEITEFVERRSYFGKIRFSPKRQNAIGKSNQSLLNHIYSIFRSILSFLLSCLFSGSKPN